MHCVTEASVYFGSLPRASCVASGNCCVAALRRRCACARVDFRTLSCGGGIAPRNDRGAALALACFRLRGLPRPVAESSCRTRSACACLCFSSFPPESGVASSGGCIAARVRTRFRLRSLAGLISVPTRAALHTPRTGVVFRRLPRPVGVLPCYDGPGAAREARAGLCFRCLTGRGGVASYGSGSAAIGTIRSCEGARCLPRTCLAILALRRRTVQVFTWVA